MLTRRSVRVSLRPALHTRYLYRPFTSNLSDYTKDFLPKKPEKEDDSVFIAPNATVLGPVWLGQRSSVWYQAVLRADLNRIHIGRDTNIQDGVLIHVTRSLPVHVGHRVSVGHGAVLHGCTIGDDSLIGMGAVLLDGCYIGKECLVAANSTCPQGKKYPDGTLIIGSPAKAVRSLTKEELESIRDNAMRYTIYAQDHRKSSSN